MILEKIALGKQSTECNIQCTIYGIPQDYVSLAAICDIVGSAIKTRHRFTISLRSWRYCIVVE